MRWKRSRHDWDDHLKEYVTEEVRARAEKLVHGIAEQDKPKKKLAKKKLAKKKLAAKTVGSGCLVRVMLLIVAAIMYLRT